MYLITEVLNDESSMTTRVIGVTVDMRMARKVMFAARKKFYRTFSKGDYVGFRYTTKGEAGYMAWVDVVCSGRIYGNTWVILDSERVGTGHGRYLG